MDKALISKLKSGKVYALEEVYKLYFETVFRFCLSFMKNEELTSDIVQEVFLKFWKNRSNISEDYPIKQQLFVISKNLVIDHFRRKIKEQEIYLEYNKTPEEENFEDTELKEINLKKIHYWINKLPKKQRTVLTMHRFQGLTYEEIANSLNISVNTVSAHMSASMRFIKKNIFTFF